MQLFFVKKIRLMVKNSAKRVFLVIWNKNACVFFGLDIIEKFCYSTVDIKRPAILESELVANEIGWYTFKEKSIAAICYNPIYLLFFAEFLQMGILSRNCS